MSASRVENSDDMAVDDSEVALPTAEWLQAAQRAAETDGILENTSAKRQKVCKSCHTLTSPAHANHAQECTQRRESLQETRVRVARSCKKKEGKRKSTQKGSSDSPPHSLPNPSRITAVSLPWHCRGTAVALPSTMRSSSLRSPREATPNRTRQNGIRTPDPGQEARGEAHWTALQGLPNQAA